MIRRLITVLIFVPIAIGLIALAVSNREMVPLTFDPFNPGSYALTIELPLFVYIFGSLAIGMIIGSLATWFKQGYYRKVARKSVREVKTLRKVEADNTKNPGNSVAVTGV